MQRFHLISTPLGYIFEGTILTFGLVITGGNYVASALVDKETMDQLRSADGALFGAAVMVVALWISKMADAKKMDARHDEMIAVLTKGQAQAIELVQEATLAQVTLANKFENLVGALAARKCCADDRFASEVAAETRKTVISRPTN